MKEQDLVKKLQEMYEDGRNKDILKEIDLAYSEIEKAPFEIQIIGAWALFRLGKYEQAKKIVLNQEGEEKALELLAQLTAYLEKDDELLREIHQKLSGNPSVCNALTIRARRPDSSIPVGLVIEAAENFIKGNNPEIAATNQINNTARLLLAKGDELKAIYFWHIALERYGEKHYHHRAAVWFWISVAYEKLSYYELAMGAAHNSLELWQKQVDMDPQNIPFKERLMGAEERFNQLQNK